MIMIYRISAEEKEMIMAGRSFDPEAQKKELETPTLPLVSAFLDVLFANYTAITLVAC